MKVIHEGFELTLIHITRYKVGTTDRYLFLVLMDGEVDSLFTADCSIQVAKEEIKQYMEFLYGEIPYQVTAYIQK